MTCPDCGEYVGDVDHEDCQPHDDHTDRRLCQGIGCPYGDH